MKLQYVIISPSPCGDYKFAVYPIRDVDKDLFNCVEKDAKFKLEVVWRTEKWFNKFPEMD